MADKNYVELPLDPEFVTPDGFYMAGYLWGSHVRSEKDARQMFPEKHGSLMDDFFKGVADGYNDQMNKMRDDMAADKLDREVETPKPVTVDDVNDMVKKMQKRIAQLEDQLSPRKVVTSPTVSPAGGNPAKSPLSPRRTRKPSKGFPDMKTMDDKGYYYEDTTYDTMPAEEYDKKSTAAYNRLLKQLTSKDEERKAWDDDIPF